MTAAGRLTTPTGQEVWIFADPASLARVTALAEPFLSIRRVSPSQPPPGALVVSCDPALVAGPLERVSVRSPLEPDRVLLVSRSERHVVLDEPDDRWRALQLLRLLRNVARWAAWEDGHVFLHGGLVVLDGAGIAFAGEKRAGKTTFLLGALTAPGGVFVSNDDVSLSVDGNDVTGHGWPRSVTVRRDSVLALEPVCPRLAAACRRPTHPHNRHGDNWTGLDRGLPVDVTLLPHELAAAMQRDVAVDAHVRALVFPRFGDCAHVEPVARREASALLEPLLEDDPSAGHDPFLAGWFDRSAPAVPTSSDLVDRLWCARATLQLSAAPAAAEQLREMLAARD